MKEYKQKSFPRKLKSPVWSARRDCLINYSSKKNDVIHNFEENRKLEKIYLAWQLIWLQNRFG